MLFNIVKTSENLLCSLFLTLLVKQFGLSYISLCSLLNIVGIFFYVGWLVFKHLIVIPYNNKIKFFLEIMKLANQCLIKVEVTGLSLSCSLYIYIYMFILSYCKTKY